MKWLTFPRSLVWVFVFLIFVWVFCTPIYIAFQPKQADREYVRSFFMDNYGVDPYKIYFLIGRYFEDTPNGRVARWGIILTIVNCIVLNMIILIMIFYIFWKMSKALKMLDSTMSKRSKRLQVQFFRALTLQTFIPLITAFIPIGVFYACPFFRINLGIYSNAVVVLLSFYSLLDGIVILVVVTDYRRAVVGIFFKKFSLRFNTSNRVDSTNHSDALRNRYEHGSSARIHEISGSLPAATSQR
ncbi:hypothetical protein WR25_25318 [Diploscapter pachys]|uniref:G-protein coupled receptors family 1 profile domain-containing protein n=1 Tax=Diploscapter pachys TaxID=2018661 RepID=A0A2A2JEM5_9BILA|nr:hypothetical protein WR25_25318 [Diploscapter pachys]